jgi:UDP:flavonoid glycosyltransferase YjiC (YdhE family)
MRVLITSGPGYGHLHPLVPLARALVTAGHDVLVATGSTLRPTVEEAGLPFAVAGPNPDALPPEVRQQLRPLRIDPQAFLQLAIPLIFVEYRSRAMAPDVLRLIDDWQPDLLVRDAVDFSGLVASEVRGIPHAAAGAVMFSPPWLREAIVDALTTVRAAYGLPPDETAASIDRYLVLASFPRSWVAADEYVPPTAHFIRSEPYNASGREELPEAVLALPADRPTVHASLGTVFTDADEVFGAILTGLCDEPLNLVLTVGRKRDPAEFGPQPANVVIEQYIPHDLLLPRCDAMLTHCGLNSIMACLALSLPMIGVPIAADQHRNAKRLADLGAATVVTPTERSPAAIRAATWDVLGDPAYRQHAEALQAENAGLPGTAHAVALLEQLACERQPIHATHYEMSQPLGI